jgi:hypothetical protein
MVTMGIFPFKKKIPVVEPGIEPGTSETLTTRARGWSYSNNVLLKIIAELFKLAVCLFCVTVKN